MNVELHAYEFPSQYVMVSRYLFEDVDFILSSYIQAMMLRRFGRRLEKTITRGNTGPDITGIEAQPETYTISSSKTVKWEDLNTAMHSIGIPLIRHIGAPVNAACTDNERRSANADR